MNRFAKLNHPDKKVRARLQAALYINRRKELTSAAGAQDRFSFTHNGMKFSYAVMPFTYGSV
jgi:hypothetical protein